MSGRAFRFLRTLLAAPLAHFLVLGSALFAVTTSVERSEIPVPPVVVRAEEVAWRRAEWIWQHGVAPSPAAEAALEAELLDEAVLHRAAIDAGVARGDPGVRRWIEQIATFVGEDPDGEASLDRAAAALDLTRSDVVIGRHLVQLARLAAGRLGPDDMPTEEDLADHLTRHAARFARPASVSLTHVYLATGRRGASLDADATVLLARLRRDRVPPARAVALGDAFIRGATLTASRAELARVFGGAFATAVWDGDAGAWLGPVSSPFGLHLVWIHERVDAATPALRDVRGRILHEVLRDRSAARRRERLQALRALYQARIER
jgi:hypothetical protein